MKATQAHSPIEFWFDFASGYAYFAALEIEALAERHGRTALWRPFTLGAAFKVTGAQGVSRTPLKGEYARHDWQRLARLKGVVFKLPARHPKVGLPAIRAFYHIERTDPNAAARLAKHIITGYFQDDLDTDDPVAIAQHASPLSLDRDMMLADMTDSEEKAIARRYGEAAVARGVFGSPWIFRRRRTVLGQRPPRHGRTMARQWSVCTLILNPSSAGRAVPRIGARGAGAPTDKKFRFEIGERESRRKREAALLSR